MKNMTITLNEETAKWARVWAAENNSSVSRLVGELLREKMERELAYGAAKRQHLSAEPKVLKLGRSYPSRDELYDR